MLKINYSADQRVCLLTGSNEFEYRGWIKSFRKYSISYFIVNLLSSNWQDEIETNKINLFIARPPGRYELHKRIFDERLLIINDKYNIPIFPSIKEVLLYENKRYLYSWLKMMGVKHPNTYVFLDEKEALAFATKYKAYPIIGKTSIGASGSGVHRIITFKEAQEYIQHAFQDGVKRKVGPKVFKGSFLKKVRKIALGRKFITQRLTDYQTSNLDIQSGYVILQENIPHEFEWRCVRIGDSFFLHKKIASNGRASGTLKKDYSHVSITLLNYIRVLTERYGLFSVAIDLFEHCDNYLINEIQCYFGQSDPYQMLINGHPGRYIYVDKNWRFEKGNYNENESYDLRLKFALEEY